MLDPAPPDLTCRGMVPAREALLWLGAHLRAAGYRFQAVTPETHRRFLARSQHWARGLADAFGWNLPFQTPLLGAARCAALATAGCISVHGEGWKANVRAASLDELIVFHSAFPTEQHDSVFFGPDTYRFVRAIRQTLPALAQPPRRVIEIGCGAGPAAIVLAAALPDADVTAADINQRALEHTAINGCLAGVRNMRMALSDLLDGVDGVFDLVVANPPYMLDAAARAYRHGGGSHGEGLAVAIVRAALQRLAPGGTLMLYTGTAVINQQDAFWRAVRPLLDGADCHWRYEELDPDVFGEELDQPGYADVDRIAVAWLVMTLQARARS